MSKYFALLYTFILFEFLSADDGKDSQQIDSECRTEYNLTMEEANKQMLDFENLSPTMKSYIMCCFERRGYIADDKKILVDKMKKDNFVEGNEARLEKVFACLDNLGSIDDNNISEFIRCFMLQA